MKNFTFDIYFSLPEIYLALSIFSLLLYGVLLSVSKQNGYPLVSSTTSYLTIQIIFFILCFTIQYPYINLCSWNYFLITDYFVVGLKILFSFLIIFWISISKLYNSQQKINSFEFWILLLLVVLALFLLSQSYDLLTTYLIVEFQSLSFYVLTSFKRSSEFSTEAGLKYFILGAFSSAFLLLGSSLLYGLTGLTNFADFNIFFTGFILEDKFLFLNVVLGLALVIASLFFKISAAPFHMWSPDVYEGAPTSVTAFFAIFPKLVIITILLRISFFSFHDFFPIWKNMFLIGAFLSLLFGSLGALFQKKWKRFLAYSSINHVGFILIGFLSGELMGLVSILLYLLVYTITTLGSFTFIMSLRSYKYPVQYQVRYIGEVINLSKINPLLTLSFTLILFSMAGIPPLSGFFVKVFILLIGVQSSAYSLVLFSIIMSSIACFYYIRIIQNMYFVDSKKWSITGPLDKINSMILGFSCIFIILFFLDIELFSTPITRMALAFLS